jgi:hypothetical protein
MGGITLVGVLGIANGAAGVFFFVLARLLILPLLELALPTARRSSLLANVITVHADRPVETATIAVDGSLPVTASPSYLDASGGRTWPSSCVSMTLRPTDSP